MSTGLKLSVSRKLTAAWIPRLLVCSLMWLAACVTRPPEQPSHVEQALARLVQNPQDPRPLLELAQSFAREGDMLRARQYLRVAGRHPNSAQYRDDIFRQSLLVAVRSNQYREAIDLGEQRLAEQEDRPVRVLLANLHEALGELRAAERERQLVLLHNPRATESWIDLARFYERSALPQARDKARRAYSQCLRLSPTGHIAERARAALRTLDFDPQKAVPLR